MTISHSEFIQDSSHVVDKLDSSVCVSLVICCLKLHSMLSTKHNNCEFTINNIAPTSASSFVKCFEHSRTKHVDLIINIELRLKHNTQTHVHRLDYHSTASGINMCNK